MENWSRPARSPNDAGLGVRATVDGHDVVVGRAALFADARGELSDAIARAGADGRTAVVAGWDGTARAVFVVADTVKPTSRDAVRALHDLGLEVVMVTGDARPPRTRLPPRSASIVSSRA